MSCIQALTGHSQVQSMVEPPLDWTYSGISKGSLIWLGSGELGAQANALAYGALKLKWGIVPGLEQSLDG